MKIQLAWVVTLLALFTTAAAHGETAPNPKAVAITDVRLADDDFRFQGEFFAAVQQAVWGCENAGLQVVARGNGQFNARLLRGGLPGAGWDRQVERRLSGMREDDHLVLRNDKLKILVRPGSAEVERHSGEPLATMPRMHRVSPTLGSPAPYGAIVLFDGSHTDNLVNGKISDDGSLIAGVRTAMPVGDFRLHLEFKLPYMPLASGQQRGNSGVYIQQRYEVQILDSFGLEGVKNECGALYRQRAPGVNMCLPPLSWQTYDIVFRAARFDDAGQKTRNAQITVAHNGQLIHDEYGVIAKTGAGRKEGPEPLPILLQDHGNPVHYRNIWLLELSPDYEYHMPIFNACPPVFYCP